MSAATVRTTVRIPGDKLQAGQPAAWRRDVVDAAFAEMATDEIYQHEATEIAEEFRAADWQALQIASHSAGSNAPC